ncbi:MAG: carbamoyltransferase HypF [Deltaproteobacteria bacterium]|nr:carbamoyltransferase HypF [Deltaproteobacteria bacterium]
MLVSGIVQGVGFRPFIYNLARRLNLGGFVINTAGGVEIEVSGTSGDIDEFVSLVKKNPPRLAYITDVRVEELPFASIDGFSIEHSRGGEQRSALVSPDVCVCKDCLSELYDPGDRRFRYPFINCTNCGPRYTIIRDIPYDRPKTTMSEFDMCPQCLEEYTDPEDRRFHAQPDACWSCGPSLSLWDAEGNPIPTGDPIRKAADLLLEGRILAVKGLGGFHLAVDATRNDSVTLLRTRKQRFEKPLAIMVKDVEDARAFAKVDPEEASLLESPQRPIVLLSKKNTRYIAEQVAPLNPNFGVLLPYTPLHYLLLDAVGKPLVMTSGNLSEEPIVSGNEEAFQRLGVFVDAFLMHNRKIHQRCDDSVTRVLGGKPRILRRSRGYVPMPIFLGESTVETLATGGELKNTVCLTKENRAFVSQHIGDMENLETFEFFKATIDHLEGILEISPRILAHDLHPDYMTTVFAKEEEHRFERRIAVQHHHAHIASCMGEHGLQGPVIGLAMDGTGYGEDGTVWGGEVLLSHMDRYERWGHFANQLMPGGEKAIKEPWRMAVSLLYRTFGEGMRSLNLDLWQRIDEGKIDVLVQMMDKGIHTPRTSSCGRLFDAVSSLVGIRDLVTYEGQAAIELEALSDFRESDEYPFDIVRENGTVVLKSESLFGPLVMDVLNGVHRGTIGSRFHHTLISAWAELCNRAREESGVNQVVLSGGVFQNRFLFETAVQRLADWEFEVYVHEKLPTNDACISFGQAVVADAKLRASDKPS